MLRRLLIIPVIATLALALGCENGGSSGMKGAVKGKGPKATSGKGNAAVKPKPEPKREPRKLSEVNSPWKIAAVGDWATFQPHFGSKDPITYTISKVDEQNAQLTFAMSNAKTGAKMREVRMNFEELEKGWNVPEKLVPTPKFSEGVLKADGGDLKCKIAKREYGGQSTESWYSNDIAVNQGIVKSTRDGKVQLMLIAHGKGK